jgi:hypothetical protein
MQNEHAVLALLLLCLLYFWLSIFALRQANAIRSETLNIEVSKNTSKFQFYIFCHSTIRWVLLIVAFVVQSGADRAATVDNDDNGPLTPADQTNTNTMRETILSDIPGLLYAGIYGSLSFEILRAVLEANRREAEAQTWRFWLFLVTFLLTLVWLVLVVLLSAAAPGGQEAMVCRRLRDCIFATLFALVAWVGWVILPKLRRVPEALLLKRLGVTAAGTRSIARVVAATFTAKALFIMALGVLEQTSSVQSLVTNLDRFGGDNNAMVVVTAA